MKNLVLVVIFSLCINLLFAEEPLAGYKKDGLWHFIGYDGEEMFEPKDIKSVGGYKNGFFIAIEEKAGNEVWSFMNTEGNIAFTPEAKKVRYFSEDGLAMIIDYEDESDMERYYGYIDTLGNVVVEPKYLSATDFVNGSAWVFTYENRGFINTKGEYILRTDDAYGYNFFEGLAALQDSSGKHGFVNIDGDTVVEFKYDEVRQFSEGLCAVNVDGKFGFIDKDGEMVIEPEFDYAKDFKDGVCFVARANSSFQPRWGLINKKGIILVDYLYENVRDFNEGVGLVKRGNDYIFIDNFGNNYLEKVWAYADEFHNGLAWVFDRETDTRGFIDPLGNFIYKFPEAEIYVDFRTNRRVF